MTLIASVALGTALVAFTSFILVARPAHRKPALVTRRKQLPVFLKSDLIPAHSAYLCHKLAYRRGPRLQNITHVSIQTCDARLVEVCVSWTHELLKKKNIASTS